MAYQKTGEVCNCCAVIEDRVQNRKHQSQRTQPPKGSLREEHREKQKNSSKWDKFRMGKEKTLYPSYWLCLPTVLNLEPPNKSVG